MNQNRIVFITGRKGSGKTFFANQAIAKAMELGNRVIVVSPMGGLDVPGGVVVRTAEEFRQADTGGKNILGLVGDDDDLAPFLFLYAYRSGDVTLVVDEIDLWMSHSNCDDSLLRIVRYGRHQRINLIAISQRPANVYRDLTAQSDFLVMFNSSENRDREYLSQRIGRENADRLRSLERFTFLVYDSRTGGLRRDSPETLSV